jgi:hypothetical protein
MGELEGLDQPLLLQVGQSALLRQIGRGRQLQERPTKTLETLTPADIWSLRHAENQSDPPCFRSINFVPCIVRPMHLQHPVRSLQEPTCRIRFFLFLQTVGCEPDPESAKGGARPITAGHSIRHVDPTATAIKSHYR